MKMSQPQLPICIQYIQAIGPTFVALVVGFVAATLTYWQWRTTNDKLKIDLFDKRFSIYAATMKILSATVESGSCSNEQIIEFMRNTKGIEFLFDKEIESYSEEIREKLNELRTGERAGPQAEARKLKDYLEEQFKRGAREKFSPYLSFAHLKWKL